MTEEKPDPRRNAWRDDLAAESLRGLVTAPRYATGEPRQVVKAIAPLRSEPCFDAPLASEVLFGETLTLFDESEGWAWVQLARDGYVGYLPSDALSPILRPATHRIAVPETFVFPAPDIKTPPLMRLALNAFVTSTGDRDGFLALDNGGFVFARHARPVADALAQDFVAVAEDFLGTPYLWGGRTRHGIDCSGLVQTALHAAGIDAPRDSDMQWAELGGLVSATPDGGGLRGGGNLRDGGGLRRGDLAFWKGHVGVLTDAVTLLHANAYNMATVREPFAAACTRIASAGAAFLGIRRIAAPAFGH